MSDACCAHDQPKEQHTESEADVRAELRPEDKAAAIREQNAAGPTAMIGDGINNAPAFTENTRR